MIRALSLFYSAPDLPRACALFEAALGVEFTQWKHLERTGYFVAQLPGGPVLELWPASGGQVTRVQIEFVVEDLAAASERIIAAGFEVRRLSGALLMTDPNGNTVALTQRPAARR